MTDEKIALLEQVTYIDKNVLEAAGIDMDLLPINQGDTVKDILEVFDEEKIQNLENLGDDPIDGALQSGKEWASIIKALKSDEEISSLVVNKCEPSTNSLGDSVNLQICYDVPGTNQGIITYKGTSGYDEWYDNCLGLTQQDTELQMDALRFYEETTAKYDDVIVAGHSKGANKAMYVTTLAEDDKISRCVGFDGQGFSNKFLEAYQEQIEKNGSKITNYAISKDFVHALMKQLPNANMVFCEGFGMTDFQQYHSPNSFFQTVDGELLLNNGAPQFTLTQEDENIQQINKFITFAMDNYPEEDLKGLSYYVGNLSGIGLGESADLTSGPRAIAAALVDARYLRQFVGMVHDYAEANNMSREDFDRFLQTFATNEDQAEKMMNIAEYIHNGEDAISAGQNIFNSISEEGIGGIPEAVNSFGDMVGNAGDFLFDAGGDIIDGIGGAANGALDWVSDKIEGLGESVEFVKPVTDFVSGAVDGVGDVVDWAGEAAGDVLDVAGDVFNWGADKIGDVAEGALDFVGGAAESVGDFIGGLFKGKTPATKETADNTPAPSVEQSNGQSTTEATQGQSQEEKGISGAAAGAVAGAVASAGAAAEEVAKKVAEAVNAAKEAHELNEVADQYSYPTGQTMEDVLSGLSAEGNIVIINPVIINGQVEGSTIAPSYNAGSPTEDSRLGTLDADSIIHDIEPLGSASKVPFDKEDLSGMLSSQGGDIALIGDIAALFGALSEQKKEDPLVTEFIEKWQESHDSPHNLENFFEGHDDSMQGPIREELPDWLRESLEGPSIIADGIVPLNGIQNVLPFDSSYTPYNFNSTEYKSIIMPEADNQMQATRRMAAHC